MENPRTRDCTLLYGRSRVVRYEGNYVGFFFGRGKVDGVEVTEHGANFYVTMVGGRGGVGYRHRELTVKEGRIVARPFSGGSNLM